MADTKISNLTELTTAPDPSDVLVILDNAMIPGAYYTKKITVANALSAAQGKYNHLINGSFEHAQRMADPTVLTSVPTDSYMADRWRSSVENVGLQYARIDLVGVSTVRSGEYKKITASGKFAVYQILRSVDTAALRGKQITFQVDLAASGFRQVKLAILELSETGSADVIPATLVASWNGAGVDPTFGANLAIIGSTSANATATITTASVTVTVPATSLNLVCIVWTNSAFSIGEILYVTHAGLFEGSTVQTWLPRLDAQELLLCQQYYKPSVEKEFLIPLAGLGQGSAAPSLTRIGNYLSYEYTINDGGYFSFETPVDWDGVTDIEVWLHWYCNEAYATRSGEVRWAISYTATKEDGTEAIDGATTTVNSPDINIPATAKFLMETKLLIPYTAVQLHDVIGILAKRIALVGGTNPVAEPGIVAVEIEYFTGRVNAEL